MSTRPPAVAGLFYPAYKEALKEKVAELLAKSKTVKIPGKLRALIVPHAGYDYSGVVAASGYRLLREYELKKFLLLGPSHFFSFKGASLCDDEFWETPLGLVQVSRVKESALLKDLPQAHKSEHCLEVQLPFLQTVVKECLITPILTGAIAAEDLASELDEIIENEFFFIASSDLSHYHSYAEALRLDSIANEAIPKLDTPTVEAEAEACGKIVVLALMNVAKKRGWKGKLLDYKNSGDTSGDKDRVVGYGCYGFYETD